MSRGGAIPPPVPKLAAVSAPAKVLAPPRLPPQPKTSHPAESLAANLGATVAAQIVEQTAQASWVWEGIAQQGDVVEISGLTTSGKSTLTFLLAAARAATTPVDVLGHRVEPMEASRSILLANVEQKRDSIKRKLAEASEALGLDPDETLRRVVVLGREDIDRFSKDGGERAKTLTAIIQAGAAIGLVILDSRAKTLAGDANDEESQAWASNILGKLAAHGAPVVVVSHAKKAAGEDGAEPSLNDVSGHHQRAAGADVVLLVTARKSSAGEVLSSRVVVAKRRDEGGTEHPEPMTFAIRRAPGAAPTIELGEGASANSNEPSVSSQVLALLAEGPRTVNAIRSELGKGKEQIDRILRELVRVACFARS